MDVRDTTEEIIMNNFIVPVTKSPHSDNVSIEVFVVDRVNDVIVPVDVVMELDDGGDSDGKKQKSIVYIRQDATTTTNEGDESSDKVEVEYLLKLKVEDSAKLYDLQYIMDAKVLPEKDDDNDDDEEEKEDNKRHAPIIAEFLQNKGCENLRAFGKKGDNGLLFKIQVPLSIYSSTSPVDHVVDVVAAWACGHEAVTLTHSVEFRPLLTRNDTCSSTSTV